MNKWFCCFNLEMKCWPENYYISHNWVVTAHICTILTSIQFCMLSVCDDDATNSPYTFQYMQCWKFFCLYHSDSSFTESKDYYISVFVGNTFAACKSGPSVCVCKGFSLVSCHSVDLWDKFSEQYRLVTVIQFTSMIRLAASQLSLMSGHFVRW